MFKQLTIASLALAALIAAPSAQAQATEGRSIKVSVEGIDLNSTRGAQVVLQRIEHAASEICFGAGRQSLKDYMHSGACVQDVTKTTVERMNSPRLTALLDGESSQVASAR